MRTKTIICLSLFYSLLNLNLLSQGGWVEQPSGTAFTLNSISFLNSNTGFAAGDSSILLRTVNGGQNWEAVALPLQGNLIYVKVFNNLLIAAINSQNLGYILKSTNLGNNWSVNNSTSLFRKVKFPNENDGYALLTGNFLSTTTNGGNNWLNQQTSFTVNDFSFPYQHSWRTAYLGNGSSYSNYLSVSYSQGTSWFTVKIVNNVNNMSGGYEKIFFFNNDLVGICSYNDLSTGRKLIKTTNDGYDWADCTGSGLSGNYLNVHSSSLQNVWLVGDYVMKSTNAGDHWLINWNTNQFRDVYFVNDNTGWLAGTNGKIYKTTNGGITALTPISEIVPSEYELFQNYPNPFNPSTKIKFAIIKQSDARLEIYNSAGKLIETLVNQSLQRGVYQITWEAGNFSSGIYFVKFTAGDFIKSNKMILMK